MDQPRSKRLKSQVLSKLNSRHVPVVMLTRLPDRKLSAQRPPTPQQFYSDAESPGSSDGDVTWEPENNSSDSDFLPAKDKPKDAKCPKTEKTTDTAATTTTTTTTTTASQPSTTDGNNTTADSNSTMIVSSLFSHGSEETKKVRPDLPEVEVKLDMEVLARKRPMRWLRGKVIEIVEKEDGRFRYKVSFDEKGRSLVSGHHLAFPSTPKLDELYVGARVVVQSQDDKLQFQPGILAELPGRKNRLRFLVFLDDHTPVYVGLPVLHLICKPLKSSLDDIQAGKHKDFLKIYMKNWPYPHLTQYKVGQRINAELEETMQKCEIMIVDCSLMQVVFQESQRKEWIYRGSMRLEHMARFLALKKQQENNEKSKQQ